MDQPFTNVLKSHAKCGNFEKKTQAHLRLVHEFLLVAWACILFLNNFFKGELIVFKKPFEKFQKHSFPNIIFYVTFDIHHAHLKTYASLGLNVWLFIHLIILPFRIVSNIFFLTLHTNLGFLRSITIDLVHCFYGFRVQVDIVSIANLTQATKKS